MALRDVLRAGSNALVGRLLTRGFTEGQVLESLVDANPLESPEVLQQAFNRGLQSWQAANKFGANEPSFPLRPSDVPWSGGYPRYFRFYVIVELFSERLDRSKFIELQPVFDSIPDMETLKGALNQQIAEARDGELQFPGDTDLRGDWQLTTLQVVAVERTT